MLREVIADTVITSAAEKEGITDREWTDDFIRFGCEDRLCDVVRQPFA